MKKPKAPKVLDAIADIVMAYRPKPKTKSAKKRQRARRKNDRKQETQLASNTP